MKTLTIYLKNGSACSILLHQRWQFIQYFPCSGLLNHPVLSVIIWVLNTAQVPCQDTSDKMFHTSFVSIGLFFHSEFQCQCSLKPQFPYHQQNLYSSPWKPDGLAVWVPFPSFKRFGVLSSARFPLKIRWSWQCFYTVLPEKQILVAQIFHLLNLLNNYVPSKISLMFENSLGVLLCQKALWFLVCRVTWLQGVQFDIVCTSTKESSQMSGVFSPRRKV